MGLSSAFGAVFNMEDEKESKERETYAKNILHIPASHTELPLYWGWVILPIRQNQRNISREMRLYFMKNIMNK